MKPKSKILIIAGSDSSGGAGIQADIRTITSLGGYAMTAITAVTSQNTTGVKSIIPVPYKEISKQIEFTCKDIQPNAIKIGMLHSRKVINSVSSSLEKIKVNKIVLDPVMVAKGGARLIDKNSIEILKKKGFWVIGLDSKSKEETDSLPENIKKVIILGSEEKGIRKLVKKDCDYLIKIKTFVDNDDVIDSLNVSNACAIILDQLMNSDERTS